VKILLVHNYYRQAGGERAIVRAQMELLSSYGHCVIKYVRDSCEIDHYGLGQKALFFPRTVFSRQTWREIHTLVKDELPDLVHIHNVFPLISPSVYRAVQALGLPIVQSVHNFRFMCPNGLFYTHERVCERCKYGHTRHAVRLKCYRSSLLLSVLYALTVGLHRRWGTFEKIDRFIALTPFSAQKLVEGGIASRYQVSVLSNSLPEPVPSPGSFAAREPYFCFTGRLSAEKGVHVALQAISLAPNLALKILGVGPETEYLKEMANECGLKNVEFMGYVTGEAKWRILRNAQALIMPSLWYEHCPMSIVESLAAGTPVIASDLGSLPHMVLDGRCGQLFPPGDAEGLAGKLVWMADHPERALQMGRAARQLFETRHRARVQYEELMRIYGEVLN
jgi:glycosyltransferase involved in cell wall biosynthesis